MAKTFKLFSVLIIISLSSCYSNNYGNSSSVKKETDHSFFWGLQAEESSLKCDGDKIAKTKPNNGFINYFARIYTLGIYWPRTLEIECSN
jgi:hypothetical protein